MSHLMQQDSRRARSNPANRKVAFKLLLVAVGMFGFGFAMVPLYGVFCDLTGLGGRSVQIAQDNSNVTASDREIKLRFLATTNSGLPWDFQPVVNSKPVRLGEMSDALFMATNPTDRAMLGHATYNVVPPEASLYFVKTECFCFTEQLLMAHESRDMPVYFYIQPDLPEHIHEITLSYTFYRNNDEEALALAKASAPSQD